jgi:hypothetical protein
MLNALLSDRTVIDQPVSQCQALLEDGVLLGGPDVSCAESISDSVRASGARSIPYNSGAAVPERAAAGGAGAAQAILRPRGRG